MEVHLFCLYACLFFTAGLESVDFFEHFEQKRLSVNFLPWFFECMVDASKSDNHSF